MQVSIGPHSSRATQQEEWVVVACCCANVGCGRLRLQRVWSFLCRIALFVVSVTSSEDEKQRELRYRSRSLRFCQALDNLLPVIALIYVSRRGWATNTHADSSAFPARTHKELRGVILSVRGLCWAACLSAAATEQWPAEDYAIQSVVLKRKCAAAGRNCPQGNVWCLNAERRTLV